MLVIRLRRTLDLGKIFCPLALVRKRILGLDLVRSYAKINKKIRNGVCCVTISDIFPLSYSTPSVK